MVIDDEMTVYRSSQNAVILPYCKALQQRYGRILSAKTDLSLSGATLEWQNNRYAGSLLNVFTDAFGVEEACSENRFSATISESNLMSYVYKHAFDDIDMEAFAAKFGMSKRQLFERFKSKYNIRLSSFIKNIRVEKAKPLLRQVRITEIAFECGFSNLRGFNRAFSEYVGISPREYRKAYR